MKSFTLQQLCERTAGILEGPADLQITGVNDVERAVADQITFIGSRQYLKKWPASKARAAFVQKDLELQLIDGKSAIRVPDVDLAVAVTLEMFAPKLPSPATGVDSRAVVDSTATLGPGVAIGAMCYVGPRTKIGPQTILHPNVTIMDNCEIGAGCVIWPGVVIRERCIIGDGCILHPNVTIGSDGFGYRPSADGKSIVKIPQIGIVRIGRAVELGAGTCIDRAKFSETTIGDGTKIDNICHIGHNCRIGRGVLMAGQVGIGGSVTIGDGVMIGGGTVIKDHITIGADARIGGLSGVMNDVPAGESWQGTPAQNGMATFREWAALRKLPEFMRRMTKKE